MSDKELDNPSDVDDSDSLSLSEGNSSTSSWRWMGFLVDVENFVPLGFPGVANQPVAPSAFTGWALLVTVLALVDWKEFGDDRAKGLHVREVRLITIEHLVATLVVSIGRRR